MELWPISLALYLGSFNDPFLYSSGMELIIYDFKPWTANLCLQLSFKLTEMPSEQAVL